MRSKSLISVLILLAVCFAHILMSSNLNTAESVNTCILLELADEETTAVSVFDPGRPFHMSFLIASYKLVKPAFSHLTAMTYLKFFNLVFGLATLIMFFVFLKLSGTEAMGILFGTLLFSFCYSLWSSSHEAESHAIQMFLIMLMMTIFAKFTLERPKFSRFIPVGIIFGILLMLDITLLLLVIPIMVYTAVSRPIGLVPGISALLVAIVILALALGALYLAYDFPNLNAFWKMVVFKSKVDGFTGEQRSLFEANLNSAVKTFALTGHGFLGGEGAIALLLRILTGALVIGVMILMFLKWEHIDVEDKRRIFLAMSWFIPMLLFYGFWAPTTLKYSIYWVAPIIIMMTSTLFSGDWITINRISYITAAVMLVLIVFSNFFLAYLPQTSKDFNPELALAGWLKKQVGADAMLVYFAPDSKAGGGLFLKYYLPFESKIRVMLISWSEQERVSSEYIVNSMNAVIERGLTPFLLIDRGLPFGINESEFESAFPGFSLSHVANLDERYFLYRIAIR